MLAELSHALGMSHRFAWGLNPCKRENKHCFDATWVVDTVQTHQRLRIYKLQSDKVGTQLDMYRRILAGRFVMPENIPAGAPSPLTISGD